MSSTFVYDLKRGPFRHETVRMATSLLKLLTFASVFAICSSNATVYYVDIGLGNDSNNGTSVSSAWAHAPGTVGISGSGWATLRNGDTLLVKGGSTNHFRIEVTPAFYQGTATYDSIIIRSGHLHSTPWGTGRAIIDGENSRTAGVGFCGALSGPLLGITFEGFEVRNIA